MADVLIRGLSEETMTALRARAKRNNRSLEAEVKTILEDAAREWVAGERIRKALAQAK